MGFLLLLLPAIGFLLRGGTGGAGLKRRVAVVAQPHRRGLDRVDLVVEERVGLIDQTVLVHLVQRHVEGEQGAARAAAEQVPPADELPALYVGVGAVLVLLPHLCRDGAFAQTAVHFGLDELALWGAHVRPDMTALDGLRHDAGVLVQLGDELLAVLVELGPHGEHLVAVDEARLAVRDVQRRQAVILVLGHGEALWHGAAGPPSVDALDPLCLWDEVLFGVGRRTTGRELRLLRVERIRLFLLRNAHGHALGSDGLLLATQLFLALRTDLRRLRCHCFHDALLALLPTGHVAIAGYDQVAEVLLAAAEARLVEPTLDEREVVCDGAVAHTHLTAPHANTAVAKRAPLFVRTWGNNSGLVLPDRRVFELNDCVAELHQKVEVRTARGLHDDEDLARARPKVGERLLAVGIPSDLTERVRRNDQVVDLVWVRTFRREVATPMHVGHLLGQNRHGHLHHALAGLHAHDRLHGLLHGGAPVGVPLLRLLSVDNLLPPCLVRRLISTGRRVGAGGTVGGCFGGSICFHDTQRLRETLVELLHAALLLLVPFAALDDDATQTSVLLPRRPFAGVAHGVEAHPHDLVAQVGGDVLEVDLAVVD
eukprot:PhM_4_TR2860/c0_g1_i1/m.40735